MPTKKSESKSVETNNTVNFSKVGKTYYDIIDVLENKINTEIVSKFGASFKSEDISTILNCVKSETASAKSWGIDQIRKHF